MALGPPFVDVHVGSFASFYHIGALHPTGGHSDQREGKYVPILLHFSGQGILDYRRARCCLLYDAGKCRSGTVFWKLHRQKVMTAGWGDVRSETGAWNHLHCSANNQPCSSLVGSSSWGCTDTATNYQEPRGRRYSLTQHPPISAGLRPLPTV